MIDWQSLFFNSLWVAGVSLLLAAFSYYYWVANQEERKLRIQLSRPQFLRFFWLSLILIALGLAGTSQTTWEIAIWIILALASLYYTLQQRSSF